MDFDIQAVIDDILPVVEPYAKGRYAVSIGGSTGKKIRADASDLDFRLFADDFHTENRREYVKAVTEKCDWWKKNHEIIIDGVWPRSIPEMEIYIAKWQSGDLQNQDFVWTLHGYFVPSDLYNQYIVKDDYGVLKDWRDRLSVYPAAAKKAILRKHGESLDYWRTDYHYKGKVERSDFIFTGMLTARLTHDIFMILFALNETLYCGDGNNMKMAKNFVILPGSPEDFERRVNDILYPGGPENQRRQYDELCSLIDDVMALCPDKIRATDPTFMM